MRKLSEYAKLHNITYRTAYNHFKRGFIDGSYQLPNGTIVITDKAKIIHEVDHRITYARVSYSENKANLERQNQRLIDFCNAKGWQTHQNISEIGSGLNDNRSKLSKLLADGNITKLVVEHKDWLTRFGFNYINILCKHIGCEIVVLNDSNNDKEDLIQDFISVITSFCARIYGQVDKKKR